MKKYRAIAKFRSRGGGHCWCGSRFHLNPKPCIMHRQRKKTFHGEAPFTRQSSHLIHGTVWPTM
jgi:hypothetical protein